MLRDDWAYLKLRASVMSSDGKDKKLAAILGALPNKRLRTLAEGKPDALKPGAFKTAKEQLSHNVDGSGDLCGFQRTPCNPARCHPQPRSESHTVTITGEITFLDR